MHLTGIEPAHFGPEPNALSTELKVQITFYFIINKISRQYFSFSLNKIINAFFVVHK